jgi:hypothetical protein
VQRLTSTLTASFAAPRRSLTKADATANGKAGRCIAGTSSAEPEDRPIQPFQVSEQTAATGT